MPYILTLLYTKNKLELLVLGYWLVRTSYLPTPNILRCEVNAVNHRINIKDTIKYYLPT